MYCSLEELMMKKIEKGMMSYAKNKEYCLSVYDILRKRLNDYIKTQDYKLLSDLLPYYEEREAFPRLIHSGETIKIYVLIKFTLAELEIGRTPFLPSVSSYEEFLRQYSHHLRFSQAGACSVGSRHGRSKGLFTINPINGICSADDFPIRTF